MLPLWGVKSTKRWHPAGSAFMTSVWKCSVSSKPNFYEKQPFARRNEISSFRRAFRSCAMSGRNSNPHRQKTGKIFLANALQAFATSPRSWFFALVTGGSLGSLYMVFRQKQVDDMVKELPNIQTGETEGTGRIFDLPVDLRDMLRQVGTGTLLNKVITIQLMKFNLFIDSLRFFCYLSQFDFLSIPIYWYINWSTLKHFTLSSLNDDYVKLVEAYKPLGLKLNIHYCGELPENRYRHILEEHLYRHNALLLVDHISSSNSEFPFVSISLKSLISENLLERVSLIIDNNGVFLNEKFPKESSGFFGFSSAGVEPLTDKEVKSLRDGLERLNTVCNIAERNQIGIIFDEPNNSAYKKASDYILLQLARKFNTSKAVILKTFHINDGEDLSHLVHDMSEYSKDDIQLGALIRRSTRRRDWIPRGERSDVAEPYDDAASFLMNRLDKATVILATHDKASIYIARERMQFLKIAANDQRVWFSQLYGLADGISLQLRENGYNVIKSVPLGSLQARMAHLRTMLINSRHLFRTNTKDVTNTWREIYRRFFPFDIFK
eukprot:Nk52_evm88s914 gene=Nk52_evmTU88s914